ncbi:MAG: glycosyltransferase family 9 protein [bacterium]|nr:glycosyltransferase family 9 protein [bacterium]
MSIKLPSSEQFLYAANLLVNRLFFKRGYNASITSILVVKLDEIGDMATAAHVFELLKINYPNAKLTVLCKPFVKSLIACDPFIDEIITNVAAYKNSYELVVELRGTWTTLFKSILYKAKYRVARAEVRAANRGKQLHEIATNTAIVAPMFPAVDYAMMPRLYCDKTDEIKVSDFMNQNGLKTFAILHVGARKILRQWPLERFASIATFLKQNYQLDIVFAGTIDDDPQIDVVRQSLNFPTYSFTNGFSLSAFSCLCSKASFYVGNESGPLHIASAFNVPLLGLFGPGVPSVFYPVSANSKVLHHVLKCNPCNQIDCVEPQNPCITRIQVLDAEIAIADLMGRINL